MDKPVSDLEILAPAGDMESVVAAVLNGATAVYLGQKAFSARQNAKNFDEDELLEAVTYCHSRGVKVYQTLNTLVFDLQEKEVIECLKTACRCSVDALIVQDLGIVAIAKKRCPSLPLHASTQMSVHTVEGARFLKEMGFSRVVLAREMTFEEIKLICENVDIEVEVFVHGALCMSVSGQCYISGMLGGRSGNRGNCAGTCRLPFALGNTESFALSLKDLCLSDKVQQLKKIGVSSLKIEGRMKRPEYVAAATDVYKKSSINCEYELEDLRAVFSRSGFTDGYFENKMDRDMFGTRQKDDVTSATTALFKSLQNTYKKEVPLVPISLKFSLKKGEKASLVATDDKGNVATATGEIPDIALNRPTDLETAKASLSKLGGTYFYLKKFEHEIDEGLILTASKLNILRRTVCEELAQKRLVNKEIPIAEDIEEIRATKKERPFTLWARFENMEQVPFENLSTLKYFSLPINVVLKNAQKLSEYKERLICEPDRVTFKTELKLLKDMEQLCNAGFKHAFVHNVSQILPFKALGFFPHGSPFLNCTNSRAVKLLEEQGLHTQLLSMELSLKDARQIKANIPLGILVYGFLPLMVFRNCPVKARLGCEKCNQKGTLTDRLGKNFTVHCKDRTYSELLNCNVLYLGDRLNELPPLSYGVFYFTTEHKEQVLHVLRQYTNKDAPNGEFTRGLYYRTV